ncbi:MAG: 8-oxo-dGTP diphosphatase [Cellvibrionaceae bacterium]|jgi:8-oxo-dGTP diphosphatase
MKKTVHVVVGVVINKDKQILIAKRPMNTHQGGLWEFPGGKVEAGEDVFDALKREFREEVAIEITMANPLMEINHDYGDKAVLLDIWLCNQFDGTAIGLEGQQIKWIELANIEQYAFPEANKAIILRLEETHAVRTSNL